MYVFVFFITSVIILQYQRIFSPEKYLEQFNNKDNPATFENIEMDWSFFSDNIIPLFFSKTMEKDETTGKTVPAYHFQFGFLVVAVFYFLFLMILYALNLTKKMGKFFFTSLHFYGITFGIYMRALINHYRFQSSKTSE
jgi:hypothetical protein